MSIRSEAIAWYYNEFQRDPLFKAMEQTVEDSPWHREFSVAVHTNMVVSEYISWVDRDWTMLTLVGFIATVFHDTGKPTARVEKFKPERGKYNSFGGHEIISARLWEDYAMRNAERIWKLFGIRDIHLIYEVGFVIEHHMPYEQPSDKIQNIATTATQLFGLPGIGEPIFQNHLTADTHGRVADDHKDKIAKVDAWIEQFDMKMLVPTHLDADIRKEKTLIMTIGPSGCGKSTLHRKLTESGVVMHHYSWDLLRLEWYDPDYKIATQMMFDDPQFHNRALKAFTEILKSGKNIFLDNTNLSRKRRKPYIDAARKAGYNVIGYVLPISLEEALRRQKVRGDKDVPADAVKQQYMALQCPLLGEFDHVDVVNTI